MQNFLTHVEAFLVNPLAALALAIVFVVVGWKYDVTASSWFLVAAWLLATFSLFRTLRHLAVVDRALWTMLVGSVIGLLLVQLDRHSVRTVSRKVNSTASSEPAQSVRPVSATAAVVSSNETIEAAAPEAQGPRPAQSVAEPQRVHREKPQTPSATTADVILLLAKVSYVEKVISGAQRVDAGGYLPYGLEVILTTNTELQSVKFNIFCTGTISDGDVLPFGSGVLAASYGVQPDHPNVFFGETTAPPFTPTRPIRVVLYAKEEIHVSGFKWSM